MRCDISELYITGMTFYSKKHMHGTQKGRRKPKYYYSNYSDQLPNVRIGWLGKHPYKQELVSFKEICKKDKRVKCDKILVKIIS